MQDPDSQWNSQFPMYAATSRAAVFGQSVLYLVDEIELEYDDGTTNSQKTIAAFSAAADPGTEWDGITSGEDFYDRFCNPSTSSSGSGSRKASTVAPVSANPAIAAVPGFQPGTQSSPHLEWTSGFDIAPKKMKRDEPPAFNTPRLPKRQSSSSALPNYPDPVVRDSGFDVISGYFLEGKGYEDVAVLAISSFLPDVSDDQVTDFVIDFQSVVEQFLALSKKEGKKKLVIDMSTNGGGAIVAATDLFVQLFPDAKRYSANNIRRSDSLVAISKVMQDTVEKNGWQPSTNQEQNAASILSVGTVASSLNPFTGIYAVNGGQFGTIADVVKEVKIKGDSFTQYQRALFNVPDATYNVTGVGSRSDPPAAVFAPEDVVVLTDGTCGSSCTIFSYFMIYDVGVKFVTVGGRPQTGKMQSLGGVEGSETYTWDTLAQAARAALILDPARAKSSDSELSLIADAYAYARAGSPPQVNVKNAFSPFDNKTPLQFSTQYANCRIFYTHEMILGPEATWQKTVDAAWTDPDSECVKDSQTDVADVYTGNENQDDEDSAGAVVRGVASVVVAAVAAAAAALVVL
jgi:hypothetical protein